MTPLFDALDYATRGWRVFQCREKNHPLAKWKSAATTDETQIHKWWSRWPDAQIGLPTSEHFVVLDVDVKESPTGLDTLNKLGFPFWFETPTVHTPQRRLSWLFPATRAAVTATTSTPERRVFIEVLGFSRHICQSTSDYSPNVGGGI